MFRLRQIENFFFAGGTIADCASKFDVSTKTVRRSIAKLREEGGEIQEIEKGFWKCSVKVFVDAPSKKKTGSKKS